MKNWLRIWLLLIALNNVSMGAMAPVCVQQIERAISLGAKISIQRNPPAEQISDLFLKAFDIYPETQWQSLPGGLAVARVGNSRIPYFYSDVKALSVLAHVIGGRAYPIALIYLKDEATDNSAASLHYAPFFLGEANSELSSRLKRALDKAEKKGILRNATLDSPLIQEVHPSYEQADLAFGTLLHFNSVFSPNNPYVEVLLDVALPQIERQDRVLVLGTGSGMEALLIAEYTGAQVDAVDINALAVQNTKANALWTGTDHLVRAWRSDLFSAVTDRYDFILFDSPIPVDADFFRANPNLYDPGGKVFNTLLANVERHLTPDGKLLMMTGNGIRVKKRFEFHRPRSVRTVKVVQNFVVSDTSGRRAHHDYFSIFEISNRPVESRGILGLFLSGLFN